jgi:hypothetical protein
MSDNEHNRWRERFAPAGHNPERRGAGRRRPPARQGAASMPIRHPRSAAVNGRPAAPPSSANNHNTPAATPPTPRIQRSLRSAVRLEIADIADRFAAADLRMKTAATFADREQAEAERREANGDFWAAEEDLADLLLLLLRYTLVHRPDALRFYLTEALRPELEAIIEIIAKQEDKR